MKRKQEKKRKYKTEGNKEEFYMGRPKQDVPSGFGVLVDDIRE
jgi:hypothetical protein